MAKRIKIPTELNTVKIIEELLGLTESLLNANWHKIDRMRSGQDGKIAVSMSYRIEYQGNERALKATIAFGERVHDSRETVIDPNQTEMFAGTNGDETNGEEANEE